MGCRRGKGCDKLSSQRLANFGKNIFVVRNDLEISSFKESPTKEEKPDSDKKFTFKPNPLYIFSQTTNPKKRLVFTQSNV